MNFDWTKPVVIDWSGRSGPIITEHDIKNSVIKRILRNQYYAPFCERQYTRVKPWWNPQDPFGAQFGSNQPYKNNRFIPGLRAIPAYPQQSTLTKTQHYHGLRVLNAKYKNVQPKGYPMPKQKDRTVFEEIRELYEAEQKEYIKWAKLLWINGDCIRALRPKPAVERVYDAEFSMKMHEMQTMPQNYALAAQIPLESKNDSFELEHKGDLINVNVRDLPMLDYPEEMESEFSVLMKSCPVPEPCAEHPCKFVLPHEDLVSVLPLSEIQRELAQYAVANDSAFVASESSLRCLVEADRGWKLPVSVLEVVCPEYGDLRTVVVLGSEFSVQKECSKQRTYRAYKHLLQHTFVPSTGHYQSKTTTKETPNIPQKTLNPTVTKENIAPRSNRFVSLDDDLEVSSDENDGHLLIDDHEIKQSIDRCEPINEPDRLINKRIDPELDNHKSNNERDIDEFSDEANNASDRPSIDNDGEDNQKLNPRLDFYEPTYSNDTDDARPNYSHDDPNLFDRLLAADVDFYEPNHSSDTNEARPSYSHNHDEPNSEPDSLFINDVASDVSQEPNNNDTRSSLSFEPNRSTNRQFVTDAKESSQKSNDIPNFYKPNYSDDTKPSCSYDETSSSPDRLLIAAARETNQEPIIDFYKPNYNKVIPSYSKDKSSSPDRLMINDETNCEAGINQDSLKPGYSNDTSDSNDSEDDNTSELSISIDEVNCSKLDTDKLCIQSFETNKNTSPNSKKNNEDSSKTIVEASEADEGVTILFETNEDNPESNVVASSVFKTDEATFESNIATNLFDSDEDISESNVDSASIILETNEDSSESDVEVYQILFETNEESDLNVEAALSLFKTYQDVVETNRCAVSSLFETYENDSETNIEPLTLLDTNENITEDTSKSSVEAVLETKYDTILFETNKDSSKKNKDYSPMKTNESFCESKLDTPKVLENSETKPILLPKVCSNEPMTSDVTCDVRSKLSKPYELILVSNEPMKSDTNTSEVNTDFGVSPKPVSPIKPCTISVRKLSIDEAKKYNLTTLLNDPNSTDGSPNKNHLNTTEGRLNNPAGNKSVCGTNSDISGVNELVTNESKTPHTRLGISGIITRNRHNTGINNVEVNEGKIMEDRAATRIETSGMITRNRRISLSSNVAGVNEPTTTKNITKVSTVKTTRVNEPKKDAEGSPVTRRRSGRINNTRVAEFIEPITETNITSAGINKPIEKYAEVTTKRVTPKSPKPEIKQSITKTNDKDNEPFASMNIPIESSQLSPVKPCIVSVKPINIEPFVRQRSISGTKVPEVIVPINEKTSQASLKPDSRQPTISDTDAVAEVNKATVNISEVPIKSSGILTRKRNVSSINNEVAKVNKPIRMITEPGLNTRIPSLATEVDDINEPVTESEASLNKSISKLIIEKGSDSSLPKSGRKLSISAPTIETEPGNNYSIENEATCKTNDSDSNEPRNKRIRKLSELINYYQFSSENPRTSPESRNCDTAVSFDQSIDSQDYSRISVTIDDIASIPNPAIRKLVSVQTEKPSNAPKPDNTNRASRSNAKTRSDKINLSELFGDESDSDEPISNISYRNAKNNLNITSRTITESKTNNITRIINDTRQLSDKIAIENSPLKKCLRKSISESPRSSKRKLSLSDLLSSDTELIVSVNEADSDENIAGFHDGVSVSCTTLPKNPKKKQSPKNTVTRTYSLRSKNNPKSTIPKKSKTIVNKVTDSFTKKVPLKTRYITRNVTQRISCSDSDNSVYSKCTNKQHITGNVVVRRSRISSRVNAEESDPDTKTVKSNAKDNSENTEGVRRSRRLTVLGKENIQSTSHITKTNDPLSSFPKIIKKDQNRRKSLPANIFYETNKIDQIIRSKSMTNLKEIAITKKLNQTSPIRSSPRRKEATNSLKLSERTKRYLRRVFHFNCSDSEQSAGEMSEPTRRYIRRPVSSACSGTEHSDTEINKRNKRYTRSSSTVSRKPKHSNRITENNLSERTERRILRSSVSVYSSCDETVQPNQIRRKINKRQPEEINNTAVSTADKMDASSVMKINKEQSKPIQVKSEIIQCTNNDMDQSTTEPENENLIESYEIKIDVSEETDESNDEIKTMNVLHFTELNQMDMSESSSYTDDQISIMSTTDQYSLDAADDITVNETKQENFNCTHIRATDTEFYDSYSNTLETNDLSRVKEIHQTESNKMTTEIYEPIKIQPDSTNTNTKYSTSKITRSRNNSDSADSSDYFDVSETEVLNIHHFTATNVTDSDESEVEDPLVIDEPRSEAVQRHIVEPNTNQTEEQCPEQNLRDKEQTKVKRINPDDSSVDKINDIRQPVISQAKVETIHDRNETGTINKTDNTTTEVYRDKNNSEDLSIQNKPLDTSALAKESISDIGVYNCTCKGTLFEVPPPRSFKKWRVKSKSSNLGFDMIVHSSHKARQGASEMVLEPIVEYQPELGGCKQPEGRIRALALSLMLRQTAGLLNVRVDYDNGNVIVVDKMTNADFIARHGNKSSEISNILHTTLNQLRFLMPGQYVLAHDPSHGTNAMLYTTRGAQRGDGATLSLRPDSINISDAEDAIFAKLPPELDAVLMPYHKYRSILPLAFTPIKTHVREDKRVAAALAKSKLPPQAIQWPKKKKKNKKPRNRPAQSSRSQD